jgi:hypothetical protein
MLACATLARAAGARAGRRQVDDLASAAGAPRVESVHARKTAALIAGGDRTRRAARGRERGAARALHSAGQPRRGSRSRSPTTCSTPDEDEGTSLVRAIGEPAARERAQALLDHALAPDRRLRPAAPSPLRARCCAIWCRASFEGPRASTSAWSATGSPIRARARRR